MLPGHKAGWQWSWLAVLLVTGMAMPAFAGAPQRLNVQGVIRDSAGEPATGTFGVRFGLYSAQTNGTEYWSEILANTTVSGGVFSAVLGADPANPLPVELFANTDTIWLGVRVEAEAELPRQRLISVPYALESVHAGEAELAFGLDCAGCVTVGALGFDPATQSELDALRTNPLAGLSCAPGYILIFNGTQWTCSGDYVTQAQLGPYVTETELTTALAPYVDNNELSTALAGYVTTTALNTTLGAYATDAELAAALLPYATAADVQAALADLGQTLGQLTCVSGQVPVFDGTAWQCDTITPELPPDGLNEISNDLLTNQFIDSTASSNTPLSIPDGLVGGIVDTLTFPNIGIAQDLYVALHLTNSDLPHLRVVLTDPAGVSFVLWCGSGVLGFTECTQTSTATEINTHYPPTAIALGDLTTWRNRNPAGTWTLRVIDLADQPGSTDGQILAWSVNIQTLSNQKVEVKGDLIVDGDISGPSGLNVAGPASTGDLTVNGSITASGDLSIAGGITADADMNVAGALTTTGLTVNGNASVTGNLTVGGNIQAASVTQNHCFASSFTGHDYYSDTWINLAGQPNCTLTTHGRPLKISMDFSAYGTTHGGIRLVMDGTTIYGTNATYGFDWVIPTSNEWVKRNLMRYLTGVPAGNHTFMVQIRAQSSGARMYISGGTASDNYSGFHLLIEEL